VLKVRGAAIAAKLKGTDPGPVTFDLNGGVHRRRRVGAELNAPRQHRAATSRR
jgi:hypothetical protein